PTRPGARSRVGPSASSSSARRSARAGSATSIAPSSRRSTGLRWSSCSRSRTAPIPTSWPASPARRSWPPGSTPPAPRTPPPSAAQAHAFGAEPAGLFWIAMEPVRGTPLDRLLEAQGRIALERFVPLLDRICEVVHTAHEAGIVHRDLKPANVMVLERAGRLLPKLLDFGIAKLAESGGPRGAPVDEAAGTIDVQVGRTAPPSTPAGSLTRSP